MSLEYFDSIEFEFDNLLNDLSNGNEDLSGCISQDDADNSSLVSSSSNKSGEDAAQSSDSDCTETEMTQNKHKRIRKYTYIPKLRVLKRDVRRSYADMYSNVWNSADLPLLFGFLDTYFQPNFQQQSFKPHNVDKRNSFLHYRETNGVIPVAKFWYTTMLLSPDMTITLGDSRVVYSEDTQLNRVEATFRMKGTRVYYVPEEMQGLMRNPIITDEEQIMYDGKDGKNVGAKRVHESTGRQSIIDSIMNSVQAMVKPFPLMPTPAPMDVEGTFVMYTDSENRISRMVMEMAQNKHAKANGEMMGHHGLLTVN